MFRFFVAMALAMITSPALANDICEQLDGAMVVNEEGEFLGLVAYPSNSDSIFNEYGRYGSEYRSDSIWNQYGKNGSEYRSNTAFNEYTRSPPRIIKNRKIVAYLTVNKSIRGGVNPRLLGMICYDFKPPH
jgi:hypothetical protein